MAALHKFRHVKGNNPNHARCNVSVTFRDNENIIIKGTESNFNRKDIGCPTRHRTRHFFNNFTTNEDITTKFEAGYRHTLQTHSFSFLTKRTYFCNIFIGVRIIKEMQGSVASGTYYIRMLHSVIN